MELIIILLTLNAKRFLTDFFLCFGSESTDLDHQPTMDTLIGENPTEVDTLDFATDTINICIDKIEVFSVFEAVGNGPQIGAIY